MNKLVVADIQTDVGDVRLAGRGEKDYVAWPQVVDIHVTTDGCLLVGCARQLFAKLVKQKQHIAGAVKAGWSGTSIAVRYTEILFGQGDNIAFRLSFARHEETVEHYAYSDEKDDTSVSGYKDNSKAQAGPSSWHHFLST